MIPNNQNIFSERKITNSSIVSTSLNGPTNKQNHYIRNNDASSNMTKKEWLYGISNNYKPEKVDNNLKNELNKLNQIYYNKKYELNDVIKENQKVYEIYSKKISNLGKNKAKYESLRQTNLNLKLMIMNIMKVKNKNKDK